MRIGDEIAVWPWFSADLYLDERAPGWCAYERAGQIRVRRGLERPGAPGLMRVFVSPGLPDVVRRLDLAIDRALQMRALQARG